MEKRVWLSLAGRDLLSVNLLATASLFIFTVKFSWVMNPPCEDKRHTPLNYSIRVTRLPHMTDNKFVFRSVSSMRIRDPLGHEYVFFSSYPI